VKVDVSFHVGLLCASESAGRRQVDSAPVCVWEGGNGGRMKSTWHVIILVDQLSLLRHDSNSVKELVCGKNKTV
jgi:hypothetical protein